MGRVVPRVLQAWSAPSALLSQPPDLHWLSSIILEDRRAFDIHLCAHRQAFCSAVMRQSLSVNPHSPVLSPGPSELRGDQTLAENEYWKWRKSMGLASTQKTNLGRSHVMARSSTILEVWRPLHNTETNQCRSVLLPTVKRFGSVNPWISF